MANAGGSGLNWLRPSPGEACSGMPPGGFGFARRGVLSTTLAELCVAKLAEYASYIRELGPVPDELVADILRRSNISGANLEAIEEANAPRDLSPVTEALWNRLCERELKDTKKPDGITWRRYYRQRVDERAEKMARTKAAMKVRLAAARADAPAPVMSIRKKSGKGAPAPRKVVHKCVRRPRVSPVCRPQVCSPPGTAVLTIGLRCCTGNVRRFDTSRSLPRKPRPWRNRTGRRRRRVLRRRRRPARRSNHSPGCRAPPSAGPLPWPGPAAGVPVGRRRRAGGPSDRRCGGRVSPLSSLPVSKLQLPASGFCASLKRCRSSAAADSPSLGRLLGRGRRIGCRPRRR